MSDQLSFQEARKLLDDCATVLDGLIIDEDNEQQVLVAILFARGLEIFRAVVAVLQQAHVYAARILARALLESTFAIIALVHDERTLPRYIYTAECERLRDVNRLLDARSVRVPGLSRSELKRRKAAIELRLKGATSHEVNVEDLARWSGMHDWYLRQYSLWSLTAHASPRDMMEHLTLSPDGTIREVDLHRRHDDSGPLLASCSLLLLRAHQAMAELFEFDDDVESRYQPLFRRLLDESTESQPSQASEDEGA